MQQVTNQQKLKPWMGFVLFAVLMAVFIFICVPMQNMWGMWGLVATELLFLVMAIAYGLIFKIPLKEMFPIKKFSARDFFGSLLLVLGGSSFGLISIGIVGALFPSTVEGGDVGAIMDILTQGPGYILIIFILAVMPAICEEAIHRGAILTNFRSVKKEWVVVLIMAVFFGINHLSFLRFINTAILGATLSYIVIKKNNILLSSLMHFTLNFSASTLSYLMTSFLAKAGDSGLTGGDVTSLVSGSSMKTALPTYFLMGVTAPFLIVLGLMLLNPAGHRKIRFLFAGIVAILCLAASVGMTFLNTTSNKITDASFNYRVTEENSETPSIDFDVEKEGNYTFVCVLMNAKGDYSFKIADDEGNVISQEQIPSGTIRTYTAVKTLEAGSYHVTVVNGSHTRGDEPVIQIQVTKA